MQDHEYGKNREKREKREKHYLVWNMAGKLKNVEYEKHTLQDLGCGEKPEKRGKCETHTVGPGIWREN